MRQFILAVLVAVALCGRAEAAGSPSVASSASCNTNAGSSVTCTVSRAPSLALGDKLVAFGIGQYNKAITPPSGFSTLRSTTTDFGEALFYKDAVTNSDPTSYTFSLPSSGNLSVALFLVGASKLKEAKA